MATRPYSGSPWPSPTPDIYPPPSTSHAEGRSIKRRRLASGGGLESRGHSENSLVARQTVVDQDRIAEARRQCQIFSGNDIISCYPTADVVVPQHQWATFVWNSRRPELTQINLVDIYLFRADSREHVLVFRDQPNPSNQPGTVTAQVDDRWFGRQGSEWDGENMTFPFYWVVIRSDETLNGNQLAQATFSAVQTTYADSVIASRSSSSVAAASSSAALAASLSSVSASLASLSSLASATRVTTINGTPTTLSGTAAFPSGNVQSETGDDSFPRWAIAVIVVLGFLAIAATCILTFLILRRIRRHKQSEKAGDSHRDSMGSASPMMANAAQQQQSPAVAAALLPTIQRPDSLRRNDSYAAGGQGAPSLHDGASGVSGEGGPFSGADALIMADAFRKMLRKPDFAAVEEGESPDSKDEQGGPIGGQVLARELAEEGREVRSVGSSRGVKVESLDDSAEHPRDPHQP